MASEKYCFFCGSPELKLRDVGIAVGMSGEDYAFCEKCLQDMTADKMFELILKRQGYDYPPESFDEQAER